MHLPLALRFFVECEHKSFLKCHQLLRYEALKNKTPVLNQGRFKVVLYKANAAK